MKRKRLMRKRMCERKLFNIRYCYIVLAIAFILTLFAICSKVHGEEIYNPCQQGRELVCAEDDGEIEQCLIYHGLDHAFGNQLDSDESEVDLEKEMTQEDLKYAYKQCKYLTDQACACLKVNK